MKRFDLVELIGTAVPSTAAFWKKAVSRLDEWLGELIAPLLEETPRHYGHGAGGWSPISQLLRELQPIFCALGAEEEELVWIGD